jgi:hypothetical protein
MGYGGTDCYRGNPHDRTQQIDHKGMLIDIPARE